MLGRPPKHGLSRVNGRWNPLYDCWHNMMNRCYKVSDKDYPNYGGRGITVCERWHDIRNFVVDMGERPEGMTLERKRNDGNYEPSNCMWATRKRQTLNRRNTCDINTPEHIAWVAKFRKEN